MTWSTARVQRTVSPFITTGINQPQIYRNTNLLAIPFLMSSNQGLNVYGYNLINSTAATAYVKFYDFIDAGPGPIVGTTVPISTRQVPASGSVVLQGSDVLLAFNNFAWIVAVTGLADSNTTAPATGLLVEILYGTVAP